VNIVKRLFGSRAASSDVQQFLEGRKERLSSAEPFRAFAPEPDSNFWQLSDRGDNSQALGKLDSNSLSLVHIVGNDETTLRSLAPLTALFVTPWDTYSAMAIGDLKRRVDSRAVSAYAVVYFESPLEDILQRKSQAWFLGSAYCVGANSSEFASLIGRVPLEVSFGPDGVLQQVKEGIGA